MVFGFHPLRTFCERIGNKKKDNGNSYSNKSVVRVLYKRTKNYQKGLALSNSISLVSLERSFPRSIIVDDFVLCKELSVNESLLNFLNTKYTRLLLSALIISTHSIKGIFSFAQRYSTKQRPQTHTVVLPVSLLNFGDLLL